MAHARAAWRIIPHVLILSAFSCDNVAVEQAPDAFQYDDVRPTLTLTDELGQVQATEQNVSQDYIEYSGSFVSASGGDPVAVEYQFPTDMSGWEVESEQLDDGWELHHVYDPDGQPASDVYVHQLENVASGYVENLKNGTTTWFDWTNVQMVGHTVDGHTRTARVSDSSTSSDPSRLAAIITLAPPSHCPPAGMDYDAWLDAQRRDCKAYCNGRGQYGYDVTVNITATLCEIDWFCYDS